SHNGGGVAPPGGGERRAALKRRESTGLWSASARDGHAQQKKREPQLHRRDFFFPVFFLTSALGRVGRTGLCLDLRTSTSASTRSPSSGPIRPRRTAYRTSSSASSKVNSPTPAAARIALTKASATGLRSTLAIPGRASSSEEICDPPSSADIENAAPALKVAPSYIGPTGPSRIFAGFLAELSLRSAVTALAQYLEEPTRSAARDGEIGVGQELAQHRAGPWVERHLEPQVELIFRVI